MERTTPDTPSSQRGGLIAQQALGQLFEGLRVADFTSENGLRKAPAEICGIEAKCSLSVLSSASQVVLQSKYHRQTTMAFRKIAV
ncbi:hypothetical protein ASF11_24225 [Acidovorax sp. Leaf76]|nr:hypothetical protein ASF11_24225 [Acidovorax sp. Leaf76]KQO35434.1 hypothetical protein ASF19_23840 [Acidovorax sp. Leaf84]KQS37333.1 hypothetical protein ASG27_24545 [Acidovorax sp. Leaf191]